jgi:SAM-dependent methyltransferase
MHTLSDECFIVLEGSIDVEAEGEPFTVGAGEFCCFPAGVYHAVVAVQLPVKSLAIRAAAQGRASRVQFAQGNAEQFVHSPAGLDLIFSVDVIHHVEDRPAYFRQAHQALKKGGRVCTVTDSKEIIRQRSPLSIYFPETMALELQRYPRIADLREMMRQAGFSDLQETGAEFRYTLSDIQMYRDKAFSSLYLISEEAFTAGIRRMEHDLADGPIPYVSRYLLLWGTA